MAAKQALLKEVFEEAEKRLSALRDEPEYPDILKFLAIQAVSSLPEGHCWIQVRKNDQGLFSQDMLIDISGLFSQDMLIDISKETGQAAELLPEPADISGGCLVFSADKKILADFSFGTLLKRAEPRLKELMATVKKSLPIFHSAPCLKEQSPDSRS